MKIYGYTVVNSERYPESYVRLYTDKQKCIDEAYKEYKQDWEMCSKEFGFEDGLDAFENPMMTKGKFIESFKEDSEPVIQCYDSHIVYDYFEEEVKI